MGRDDFKKKGLFALISSLVLWLALFNLSFDTPLSKESQALFDEYFLQMGDSPAVSELAKLKSLVVETPRLCDTSTQDCLAWLAEQSLQSAQAEDLARMIIAGRNFRVSKVPGIEDPLLPYGDLYKAIQSYQSRVLNDATLWGPLVVDLQHWCNQQMDLVGYISCIAMIEDTLDVGEYLVKKGRLTVIPEVILTDDAIRLPLIGEWIQVNAYISGSFEKETFGWKYWVMPKLARRYFVDVNAMVNASADEFHQLLGYLEGDEVVVSKVDCDSCGTVGSVIHQVSGPDLTEYIDRHHALITRIESFGI
ncbi:MAG: hypothetical protein ABJ000_14665 [Saccharospirillum sp.]|uniref:hypothetical protein n=1 Tax=Saccharospirillum sp. TaxID=2033801 RepID=UPI0032970ACF